MKVFKEVIRLIMTLFVCLYISNSAFLQSAMALNSQQRRDIENRPWFDPTDCYPSVSGSTGSTSGIQIGQTWFMGDSLTHGLKDLGELGKKLEAKGFPNKINDRGGRAINYAGEGGVGQEAGSGLEAVDNDAEFIRSSKNIVVALGTNDANGTSTMFNTKQEELLNKIKLINPNAKIFWVDVAAVGNGSNYNKDGAQLVNTNIHNNTDSRGYSTISQFRFVWGADQNPKQLASKSLPDPNKLLSSDGIHYSSPDSYKKYADYIVDQLAKEDSVGNSSTSLNANCTCRVTGIILPSNFTGDDNVEIGFNFLNGNMGITPQQAAGIIGNFMLESGGNVTINPNALNNIGAFGIAQWLGGRKDRLVNDFAPSKGLPETDLRVQLEFVIEELKTTEVMSLEELKKTTTPSEAAEVWDRFYERSGAVGVSQRQSNAEKVYELYGANISSTGGFNSTYSNCSDVLNGGSIGISSDGFIFPLKTTKTAIKAGNGRAVWCFNNEKSCHGVYPAADIFINTGTEVVASKDGVVQKANPTCTKNCSVTIKGEDGNVYFYTHMAGRSIAVSTGQVVKAGDLLGRVGTAADAENTSPHLHFDIFNSSWDYRPGCSRENKCPQQVDMIDAQTLLVPAYKNLPE